jgi:uncharacterized protein
LSAPLTQTDFLERAVFSLQTIFGKGDQFFTLLEQSAQAGLESAQAVTRLVAKRSIEVSLDEFTAARTREKELFDRIGQELVNSFVTALEREDIESLSAALYKIPKINQKFAERFLLARSLLADVDFAPRAALVEKAATAVVELVKMLRKMKLDEAKSAVDRLKAIETEADRQILEDYRDVYTGRYQPLTAFALKDLYELLEKAVDRCRDAGNVVYHTVLKNS